MSNLLHCSCGQDGKVTSTMSSQPEQIPEYCAPDAIPWGALPCLCRLKGMFRRQLRIDQTLDAHWPVPANARSCYLTNR